MKIVMFGTGDFAVPAFRGVINSRHKVLALYTQPDRMRNAKEVHPNAMKQTALEHGIAVFQPPNINEPQELESLRALGADMFLVAAYGQILSRAFLAIPLLGSFNIHASLLPKYRGAAPINYAILQGETETGVTLIEVVPKLDAGPMVGVVKSPIGEHETAGELEVRLAELAVPLTLQFLEEISAGPVQGLPQDSDLVTLAPKMTKELGLIDWSKSARLVDCQIRAVQPWPTPYSYLHQVGKPPRRLVIRKVHVLPESPPKVQLGEVLEVTKDGFSIQTGSGTVRVEQIQPEGKKAMSCGEFLRGYPISVGDRFGADDSGK